MKAIVTTTIYNISPAIKKYISFKEWIIYIVGDLKTPHNQYELLAKNNVNVKYLSPKYQEELYKTLSDMIGWNTIERRNIGYVKALQDGATIIASIDDDNIPFDNWGKNLLLGKSISVYYYESTDIAFDPVSATNYPNLWHRGFPIQKLHSRTNTYKVTLKNIIPDVQADFWNGDPDIDAVCRLEHKPVCYFDDKFFPMATNTFSPFNSQNTFFTRNALKKYLTFPFVGRMDDIWASYYLEALGFIVVYNKASVFQDRNLQNLTKNLTDEYIGYTSTETILKEIKNNPDNIFKHIPSQTKCVVDEYFKIVSSFE